MGDIDHGSILTPSGLVRLEVGGILTKRRSLTAARSGVGGVGGWDRVNLWRETYLTRDEVVRLLDTGTRWSVTYCEGSRLPPATGHGQTLPEGVLERIPTAAARRKLQRGTADKTYFRAGARRDASETVLELVEDL